MKIMLFTNSVGLQLYREGKLYSSRFLNVSCMLCFVHHHASWHIIYHVKHRIICIRVVHTRVRRFVLNKCWRGWCWSSFGEDDSPMVLVSNLTSTRTYFSATEASPGAFKPFLEFYKSLSFILWVTALSN
jgi:hypothetical protein